ncbi:MAG: Ig-like domain-containing protein [Oscillospiraceae bacterium]|nr:Ig-like domain-containing protein [Oscillospiraceae bacterium]
MVEGLADGTVDIAISNGNSQSERKGVIRLTVGNGGSEEPPAGNTVNITPTTSNPSESISIDVDETFVINVTNESTHSDYDFTATFSKSGVAEIQGSATVTVAKSSTGTLTVKGIADGTVDITISNNNSSSERKATIHVTVGNGGSEEPPTPGTETRYVETSSFVLDGEYVIGAIKDDSSVYAIQKNGSSAKVKSLELSVSTNENDGKAYVVTSEATAVWEYGSDSFLHNGSDCLFPTSSNGVTAYPDTQSNLREITFTDNHKLSFVSGSGTTYFITCSNGTFDTSTTEADAATFRLFVKTEEDPGPVSVTGVTLDKETMALTVGGTGILTATVAPDNATNKNVAWSSSENTVATVDATGKVTAVAAGTATITATTEDGEKTATCTVTVTEPQEMEASVSELMKLKDTTVWLIQVKEENGKGITYKGDAMVWSSRYEAYVITAEGETAPAPAAADFAVSGDAAAAVEYPAGGNDANGSKKTDMSDVQYIYNLYKGKYDTLNTAGGLAKVLGADVNGDGKIDSSDAAKVLTALREAAI